MMKKFFTLLVLAGFLFLPLSVLGAVIYERTPSGVEIYNPVSFYVSADEWTDLCSIPEDNEWNLVFFGEPYTHSAEHLSKDILTYTFIEELPLGSYLQVSVDCYPSGVSGLNLEKWNYVNPIFILDEASKEPVNGITDIGAGTIRGILDYIGDLFSGVWLVVALIIGLPLGFWVLRKVINLVKTK